jgi:hypothetical protein
VVDDKRSEVKSSNTMHQDIKAYLQQLSPDSFATAADLFSESFPVEILSDSELEGVAGGQKITYGSTCKPTAIKCIR